MNTFKLSVVVPVFNVEKYIRQCVDSLLSQTEQDIEIILVDDGSTDNSGKICDEYAHKNECVKVFHKKNEGLVSARKYGYSIANGQYVGNVDGDDWVEPDMYEKLLNVAEQTNCDIAQSGYFIENDNESNLQEYPEFYLDNITLQERVVLIEKILSGNQKQSHNTFFCGHLVFAVFKRELLTCSYNKLADNMSNGEDIISSIYLLREVKSIVSISGGSYHYRIRRDSLSHLEDRTELLKREIVLFDTVKKIVLNEFPDYDLTRIDKYIFKRILNRVSVNAKDFGLNLHRYSLNNPDIIKNRKIVLYGAGSVGQDYNYQIKSESICEIVKWIDKKPVNDNIDKPIVIKECQYDYILIAVMKESIATEIEKELMELGVCREKCLWYEPREWKGIFDL